MRIPVPSSFHRCEQIEPRFLSGSDKNVGRSKFGDCARVLWPRKTAEHIAAAAGVNVRTAERWLAGKQRPDIKLAAPMFEEMFPRE